MIFLSLMFIVLYLSFLVKGRDSLLGKTLIQYGEYNLKKATSKEPISKDEETSIGVKIVFMCFTAIVIFVCQIIYLVKAIKIDIFLYPTLAMMLFYILNLVTAKSSKEYDLTTEEGRYEKRKAIDKFKKRSFKGTITHILYLGYFSYIFYILVFLNR